MILMDFCRRMFWGTVDLVLPPRCAATGQIVDRPGVLAPEAWSKLRFIGEPCCARCGYPFDFSPLTGETGEDLLCGGCLAEAPPYATARAALVYDDASREMILKFKHADFTHNARSFALWLQRAGGEKLAGAGLLVPVPLHRWRLLRRRYNQAALLAASLARLTGKAWRPDILIRRRATAVQGRGFRARHRNVRSAFAFNPRHAALVSGQSVVLIDDVYTSGATVKECAKALLQAGAREVHVLTVARVVRPEHSG